MRGETNRKENPFDCITAVDMGYFMDCHDWFQDDHGMSETSANKGAAVIPWWPNGSTTDGMIFPSIQMCRQSHSRLCAPFMTNALHILNCVAHSIFCFQFGLQGNSQTPIISGPTPKHLPDNQLRFSANATCYSNFFRGVANERPVGCPKNPCGWHPAKNHPLRANIEDLGVSTGCNR